MPQNTFSADDVFNPQNVLFLSHVLRWHSSVIRALVKLMIISIMNNKIRYRAQLLLVVIAFFIVSVFLSYMSFVCDHKKFNVVNEYLKFVEKVAVVSFFIHIILVHRQINSDTLYCHIFNIQR